MAIKLRKGFNPVAMKQFVVALQNRPKTVQTIAAEVGVQDTTIRVWLELFRAPVPGQVRLVYIADWKRTGCNWTAMYMWGNEEDVLKPKPLTQSEYCKAWRRRKGIAAEKKEEERKKR